MRLHMLARANCWQAMVYDVMQLHADSLTHAKMQRHPCASLFKLSAGACSDCPTRACPNSCKGLFKLPARVWSNCLQGFGQIACKGWITLPARAFQTACKGLVKLPARVCSDCLPGFVPVCEDSFKLPARVLFAITFFTPAASCAGMLLWPLLMRTRKKQMKRRKPVRQPSSQQVKLILAHQLRRLMLPSGW